MNKNWQEDFEVFCPSNGLYQYLAGKTKYRVTNSSDSVLDLILVHQKDPQDQPETVNVWAPRSWEARLFSDILKLIDDAALRYFGCLHEAIDNGTRISECRKCKIRMEFANLEWAPAPKDADKIDAEDLTPEEIGLCDDTDDDDPNNHAYPYFRMFNP